VVTIQVGCRRIAAAATFLAVLISIAWPATGQTTPPPDQGPVTLTADHIQYDTQTGDVVADGHVVATRGSTTITADHLTGNLKTGNVQATGHVVLVEPGRTATGEDLHYNYRTRVGEMTRAVAKYTPWTVTGQTVTTAAGQGVALGASATPCNPAHPAFFVRAKRVVVVPDDRITAYDAVLYVYGVPVFYVPTYTASLKKGHNARSGPTVGYDNINGVWVQYSQFVPVGDWDSQISVLYGTRSGLSGAADVYRDFSNYLVDAHFGRIVTFDQNGNLFNLDRYTVEVDSHTFRVPGLPLAYTVVGQAGSYYESQTGTRAFRTEGLLTLTGDTLHLGKDLTGSFGALYRYDAYDPGQRSVVSAAAALTDVLNRTSSATLSYNFAQVYGATPFLFDAVSPDSAVSLSYSYYPGGWFQAGTISASYDFLSMQTTGTLGVSFAVSPSVQLGTNVTYSFTTHQATEIDYVANATCDCLGLGIVYQTFPLAPSTNRWYITVGINTLPGVGTTFKFNAP
jgi:lipopolysaccharide export system protein LptA